MRQALHANGLRYRVNYKGLPGSPDIVFASRRMCIFIHGCFWHRHQGCPKTTTPKTNTEFWSAKFQRNQERDQEVLATLKGMGWSPVVVWECETEDMPRLLARLLGLLSG